MKDKQKSSRTATSKASQSFSAEERAAMRERARELRGSRPRSPRASAADGEADLLAKIAEMAAPDRQMAERLDAVIRTSAPALLPRTWYGMPAYAKDGDVICFFQPAKKFNTRYATLGFSDKAKLDEGNLWPNAFALLKLSAADEARIAALVRKAVS